MSLLMDVAAVVVMQEREDASLSDWDRFARTEYIRLAMEEEGEDAEPESSTDLWENSVSETPICSRHDAGDSLASADFGSVLF